jgi:hypothetical protein
MERYMDKKVHSLEKVAAWMRETALNENSSANGGNSGESIG